MLINVWRTHELILPLQVLLGPNILLWKCMRVEGLLTDRSKVVGNRFRPKHPAMIRLTLRFRLPPLLRSGSEASERTVLAMLLALPLMVPTLPSLIGPSLLIC